MKLRIAEVAPLWYKHPPKMYGGTERVVYNLTEGLVKAGHDVTFFASGDSKTSAKLVSVYPRSLTEDGIAWTNIMYPLLNMTEAIENEKEFDIIHLHLNIYSDYIALPLVRHLKNKAIFTVHFPGQNSYSSEGSKEVLQKYSDCNFISISNAQRIGFPDLNWIGTVHNGIDLTRLKFHSQPKDYFVWLGKFKPEKGTKEAILAAKKAGVKLVIGGAIDTMEPIYFEYYQKEVKPLIDNEQIIYIGEVNEEQKNELLGNATGFLNPIQWNEPFGLVMAESLATGTPVISYRNGSAPEVIADGKTGYLVDSFEDMVERMKDVEKLQRKDCRRRAVEFFSSESMSENYSSVFEDLLNKNETTSSSFTLDKQPADMNIEQYYHQQIYMKHSLKNKMKV